MLIVERTPFEKGASLKLSPENFWFYFSPYRAPLIERVQVIKKTCNIQVALYKGKNQIKVFGKGLGGKPFLRKGSPDN